MMTVYLGIVGVFILIHIVKFIVTGQYEGIFIFDLFVKIIGSFIWPIMVILGLIEYIKELKNLD